MSCGRIKRITTIFLTILVILSISTAQVCAASLQFTDISASRYDWVRPYIQKMSLAGVVKGMTDTTYGPDANVTREQLVTMLVRLMGWESLTSGKSLPSNFPRSSVAPYETYVAVAIEKGICPDDFRPRMQPRSEVAVLR